MKLETWMLEDMLNDPAAYPYDFGVTYDLGIWDMTEMRFFYDDIAIGNRWIMDQVLHED